MGRSGGVCAGTVRAACLSRTHGSTSSGLFSDVQPLAGSESVALLKEKLEQRQQWRNRKCSMSSTEPCSRSKNLSASVPSLPLAHHGVPSESYQAEGDKSKTSSKLEAEVGRSPEMAEKRCEPEENASEAKLCGEEHPCISPSKGGSCAGSAFATVRAARRSACGGA